MLEIINLTKQPIKHNKILKVVELFLSTYKKKDYLVSLVITGDAKIKTLNYQFRGINEATDVLSFRQEEYMGNILGEIVINLREAKRLHKYAELLQELKMAGLKINKQVNYIFYFLLVHGLLHLIGYNDDSEPERKEMLDLGKKFMKKIALMI